MDARWWRISRTVMPPAYKLMIIESRPSSRRCPLRTKRGVNEPARSLGTSISKGPTSESTVLAVVPFLVLGRADGADSPLS